MRSKMLLLAALIFLFVSGCSTSSDNQPISGTGIKILQDSPEQAYLTYFELFNSKDRTAAYDLISPQNRKNATKKEFQEWLKTVPYKKEKVLYTTSSEDGSLAVTGAIKLIDVNDTTAAVYSIFALVKDGNKWYVEMDVEGLGKEKGKAINKLALDVHKKVKKALTNGEINLDKKFAEQIKGQVTAFEDSVQSQIKSENESKTKTESKSKKPEGNSPLKK